MRIALVIDDLSSGGAQRQLCILARMLAAEGHTVELFKFHPSDFFQDQLNEAGIAVRNIGRRSYVGRAVELRSAIRSFNCEIAIAFLAAPSFFLELAGLPSRRFGIIVSERSGRVGEISWRDRLFLNAHRMADALVTNTHAMKCVAERTVPALRGKTHVIVNCVDTEHFRPSNIETPDRPTRFVVPARVSRAKNAIGLANAVHLVRQSRPDLEFTVEWYGDNYFEDGKPTSASQLYLEVDEHIRALCLEDVITFKSPIRDLLPIYQSASALVLPSFFEGCSNAICEALACGLPVLTSDVCDNSLLVQDGASGLLFDPLDHSSIADAMIRFCETDRAARRDMGIAGRDYAERKFSQSRFLDEYLSLIRDIGERRGLNLDSSRRPSSQTVND